MEFRILGPLEVAGPDGPIAIDAGKVRALLELLLLHANEVIQADRLVDSLWGESPSESAEHAVEVYVSRLRRALGPGRIETHGRGYRVRVEAGELDLHRFETLTADARGALAADDPGRAVRLFHEAEALRRGPALTDLRSTEGSAAEVTRLDELLLAATEGRIDAMLATGRHAELVPELKQLVADEPFRERLLAQYMLALYRSGRQVDALAAYQDQRRALNEEMGLEPGPALQQLQVAILRQDPELRVGGGPSSASTVAGESIAAGIEAAPAPRASYRRMSAGVARIGAIVAVAGGALLLWAITGRVPGSSGITLESQKLLDQLPGAVVQTCVPEGRSERALGNVANLWCDLPPIDEADEVWFHRFSNLGLLNTAFNDIAQRQDVAETECSEATARGVAPWGVPDVHRGRLLCYEADGAAWIVWTYEDDGILARARRGGSDSPALWRWWRETARFLR